MYWTTAEMTRGDGWRRPGGVGRMTRCPESVRYQPRAKPQLATESVGCNTSQQTTPGEVAPLTNHISRHPKCGTTMCRNVGCAITIVNLRRLEDTCVRDQALASTRVFLIGLEVLCIDIAQSLGDIVQLHEKRCVCHRLRPVFRRAWRPEGEECLATTIEACSGHCDDGGRQQHCTAHGDSTASKRCS